MPPEQNKPELNPLEFLKGMGIYPTNIAFSAFIDGHMRMPDLADLMDKYANAKIEEYKKKNNL